MDQTPGARNGVQPNLIHISCFTKRKVLPIYGWRSPPNSSQKIGGIQSIKVWSCMIHEIHGYYANKYDSNNI